MKRSAVNAFIIFFWLATVLSVFRGEDWVLDRVYSFVQPVMFGLMLEQRWSLFADKNPSPRRAHGFRLAVQVKQSDGSTVDWLIPGGDVPSLGAMERERYRRFVSGKAIQGPRFWVHIARYVARQVRTGQAHAVEVKITRLFVPSAPGPIQMKELMSRTFTEDQL